MKKLLFTLAILSLSLSFFIGCSKDKKDDPTPIITIPVDTIPVDTIPTPPPPPPPTAADTLNGTWIGIYVNGDSRSSRILTYNAAQTTIPSTATPASIVYTNVSFVQ